MGYGHFLTLAEVFLMYFTHVDAEGGRENRAVCRKKHTCAARIAMATNGPLTQCQSDGGGILDGAWRECGDRWRVPPTDGGAGGGGGSTAASRGHYENVSQTARRKLICQALK